VYLYIAIDSVLRSDGRPRERLTYQSSSFRIVVEQTSVDDFTFLSRRFVWISFTDKSVCLSVVVNEKTTEQTHPELAERRRQRRVSLERSRDGYRTGTRRKNARSIDDVRVRTNVT